MRIVMRRNRVGKNPPNSLEEHCFTLDLQYRSKRNVRGVQLKHLNILEYQHTNTGVIYQLLTLKGDRCAEMTEDIEAKSKALLGETMRFLAAYVVFSK